MALNVGSLFVSLDARTTGLMKGLSDGLRAVEKFSKEVKKAAGDVAQISGTFVALGSAAVALAGQVDGPTRDAMRGLKMETTQLAVEVARVLLPAVRELGSMFRTAAQGVASLSPEMKAQVSHYAVLAVQVGVAAKAISMIASVASGFAGILSSLTGAIAAIGLGPILAVVAAVAVLAAVIAALHAAWRTNWGGMRDYVLAAVDRIGAGWQVLTDFMYSSFSNAIKGSIIMVNKLLTVWGVATTMFAGLNSEQTQMLKTGVTTVQNILTSMANNPGQMWKSVVTSATEAGAAAADNFKSEWGKIFNETGLGKMVDKVRGAFSSGAGSLTAYGFAKANNAPQYRQAIDGSSRGVADALATWAGLQKDGTSNSKLQRTFGSGEGVDARAREMDAARKELAALQDPLRWFKDGLKSVTAGLEVAGGVFVSKLGDAGSILQSGIKGGEAGGVIGAVLAVAAELVVRGEAFAQLLATIQGVVNVIVQALDPLISSVLVPVQTMIATVGVALGSVVSGLAPLFTLIGGLLHRLQPALVPVVMILRVLAPIVGVLGTALSVVFDALGLLAQLIFRIMQGVGIAVVWAFRAVLDVWNWIVGAIADAVQGILNVITLGTQQAWAQQVADGIRSLQADTGGLNDAMTELTNMSWESAQASATDAKAKADSASATKEATEATLEFTEALTNAPRGFKIAMARFAADGTTDEAPRKGGQRARFLATGNPAGG